MVLFFGGTCCVMIFSAFAGWVTLSIYLAWLNNQGPAKPTGKPPPVKGITEEQAKRLLGKTANLWNDKNGQP